MESTEACSICGCTETNLVDGFYYCVECGTQDTNVRETLVEFSKVGEGDTVFAARKKITQFTKAKEIEMTDDWYKWHSLNFLLNGLADELIEYGAAPTFKTKLLWVWTRYMKRYQHKADFGLADANEEPDENQDEGPDVEPADNYVFSSDDESSKINKQKRTKMNIKTISIPLVITLLYVALNLDKSHIQLTHLFRLITEGRISIRHWQKLIPSELRPKKLGKCLFIDLNVYFKFSCETIRKLGLDLFRELDLGNPVVPDLRPLLELYFQELCLPNGLKPLVCSLMQYRWFDYLDVNVNYKELRYIPSYELYVMGHILLALKIVFGLDGDYEVKLSDAVDKINELEDHPKSYNSEPTERFFSFREWANYIKFRKTLLKSHSLHLGAPNYFDMDDYVTFEHLEERRNYKKTLKDEITAGIINKIPSGEVNVIPRSEFIHTFTPHSTYTQVILEYQQDKKVKNLLSEDFTQYSVKYFMEDMFLVDPDSTNPMNILTGVSERNKVECKKVFEPMDPRIHFLKGMVYVKDCDNHNWTVTQRPQMEHVTTTANNDNEKDKDHGYVSNSENILNNLTNNNVHSENSREISTDDNVIVDDTKINITNDCNSVTETEITPEISTKDDNAMIIDSSSISVEVEIKNITPYVESLQIRDEDEEKNIFDDDFANLEPKKEENEPEEMDIDFAAPIEISETLNDPERYRFNELNDRDSDVSSIDSLCHNPQSLDRAEAIKELIVHACEKYKITLPGIYKYKKMTQPKNTKKKVFGTYKRQNRKGEATLKINDLIAGYHSHIQNDVLYQMSSMVQSAIADFNKNKDVSVSEDIPLIDDNMDTANESLAIDEDNPPDTNQDTNETGVDNEKYNLFSDSSDGETHAEDLLPKKNPEYDEKTHDVSQLYIEKDESAGPAEMTLNPNLFKVIDKAIEADNNKPVLDTIESENDSEEEVSLNLLQEQKRLQRQIADYAKRSSKNTVNALLPGDGIPSYQMWIRHYKTDVTAYHRLNQRFANEIDEKFPKSFVFVLKECADVVRYPPFNVYRNLQRIEACIKDRYVSKKRFVASYFEKEKIRKLNHKF